MHILIVEDEPKLARLVQDYLENSHFQTTIISCGSEVIPWMKAHPVDLVLLDVMLPGKDGMQVCKEIRQFSNVPLIMLTARIEEIDRLLGLELGADDYICKPFSPRELVARIKAVLRRMSEPGQAEMSGNILLLDHERMLATVSGRKLDLTAVEFQLLVSLAEQPGRIFSRAQLMTAIYADHRVVSDRTIDSHIKKLRKKVSAISPDRELIHSVYGVGYKFEY